MFSCESVIPDGQDIPLGATSGCKGRLGSGLGKMSGPRTMNAVLPGFGIWEKRGRRAYLILGSRLMSVLVREEEKNEIL